MAITVSYRGRLADPSRIEDFEDRILDFALEVGGLAQIWRSHADDNSGRMVRGVIIQLAPGQETTSLLIAPEGWLIGLTDIHDAAEGRLPEPPWCFVKTQFGPLEGHVALIEMLRALGQEFLSDLAVNDEGGYWETRDLAELRRRRRQLQEAIDGLAGGLERHGLSPEAAEDPELLCKRMERIAAQVQRTLHRPAEHPPVTFPEEEGWMPAPDAAATEAAWDEMYKHNRRNQECFHRALEERRGAGQDDETAFDKAIEDMAFESPHEEEDGAADADSWHDDLKQVFADAADEAAAPPDLGDGADIFEAARREQHPLLERATDFMTELHHLFHDADPKLESALRSLFQGAGDMTGGLAQALSDLGEDDENGPEWYGLRVVQFKRALRGAAFAKGALLLLRDVVGDRFTDFQETINNLEKDIFEELGQLRSQYPGLG